MRSRAFSRSSRRRYRKNVIIPAIAMVALATVVTAGVVIFTNIGSGGYSDEETFISYADEKTVEIASENQWNDGYQVKNVKEYEDIVSQSVSYPVFNKKEHVLNQRVKSYVNNIQKKYRNKRAELDKESDENRKNRRIAYITSFETFKSDYGTKSVLMRTCVFDNKGHRKMEKVREFVKPFSFIEETGGILTSNMIFNQNYREKFHSFFEKSAEKKYGNLLIENWKKGIDPTKASYDKFILTGDSAIFFFDNDVTEDNVQPIELEVDKYDFEDVFKEKIDINSIDPDRPMVALTFDDGPAFPMTGKIVNILEKNNARGTFFILGKNVEESSGSKKLLEHMLKSGCEIGSHSYNHPNLYNLSDSQIREQSEKTDKAIKDCIGQLPTVYRPPYGNGNDKITEIFNKPGALWSVDTLDWKYRNADSIVNVIKNSGNLDGKVVLMHSIYQSSVDAAEKIIPWLQEKGYQLVTVSELLAYKYNQDPATVKYYGYGYFK